MAVSERGLKYEQYKSRGDGKKIYRPKSDSGDNVINRYMDKKKLPIDKKNLLHL